MIVATPEVGHWVAKRIFGVFHESSSVAIGLQHDGVIVAGVIYESWNHRSIVCHIAIDGRMTKRYLWAIFDYPFNVAGVEKIICPVASVNAESIRLVQNMGFAQEAKIADAHPEGDILIYTMARSSCRFLGKRYGQIRASSSATA